MYSQAAMLKRRLFKTNGIGCKLLFNVHEVDLYAREVLTPKNTAALQ